MNKRINKREFSFADPPPKVGTKKLYKDLTKTTVMLPAELSNELDRICLELKEKYSHVKGIKRLSKGQLVRASVKPYMPELKKLLNDDYNDIDILKILDL